MMGQDDRCGWLGDRCGIEPVGPWKAGCVLPGRLRDSGFAVRESGRKPGDDILKTGTPGFLDQKKQLPRSNKSPRGRLFGLRAVLQQL